MRFKAQQARWVREHRTRVRLGKAVAFECVQEHFGMATAHICIGRPILWLVTEITPAIDYLLGRTAADAELQPSACNQIRGSCVFRHVKRIFVAHVDDRGADFDGLGLGADCCQQRKGRGELPGKMVDAKVGTIRTELFRSNGEVDRLEERIACGAGLRLGRRRPVAEGEKANFLHDFARWMSRFAVGFVIGITWEAASAMKRRLNALFTV
jgi:hypothetical protein